MKRPHFSRPHVEPLEQRLLRAGDLAISIPLLEGSEVAILDSATEIQVEMLVTNNGTQPLHHVGVDAATADAEHLQLVPRTTRGGTSFAKGELLKSFEGIKINRFLEHPYRPIVFATVESTNSVAVFDLETLTLIDTIPVGIRPEGMALTPDGQTLYVANSRVNYLSVIDTWTLESQPDIPLQEPPYFVEVTRDGMLFVKTWQRIIQVNPSTGQELFSSNERDLTGGFLLMSPEKDRLYHGNEASSRSVYHQWDITVHPPRLLAKDSTGVSSGRDLKLSQDGRFLSYVRVNERGHSYSFSTIDTDTMTVRGYLDSGAYPRELAYSPDSELIYTVNTSNEIKVWDNTTLLQTDTIRIDGLVNEMLIDRSGQRIFSATDVGTTNSDLMVYGTGRGQTSFNVGDLNQDFLLSPGETWEYTTNLRPSPERKTIGFRAQGTMENETLEIQSSLDYIGLEHATIVENRLGAPVYTLRSSSDLGISDDRFAFRDTDLVLKSTKYVDYDSDNGLRLLFYDPLDSTLVRAAEISVVDQTSPWLNPDNVYDVNADNHLSAIDALIVINDINQKGARRLPAQSRDGDDYLDTNGDGFLSPIDGLLVINALNQSDGEAEHSSLTAESVDSYFIQVEMDRNGRFWDQESERWYHLRLYGVKALTLTGYYALNARN